jgi:hypothetical protein
MTKYDKQIGVGHRSERFDRSPSPGPNSCLVSRPTHSARKISLLKGAIDLKNSNKSSQVRRINIVKITSFLVKISQLFRISAIRRKVNLSFQIEQANRYKLSPRQ